MLRKSQRKAKGVSVNSKLVYNIMDLWAPTQFIDPDSDVESLYEANSLKLDGFEQKHIDRSRLFRKIVNVESQQAETTFKWEVLLQFRKPDVQGKTDWNSERDIDKVTFFTDSEWWAHFWINRIQGLHNKHRECRYDQEMARADIYKCMQKV